MQDGNIDVYVTVRYRCNNMIGYKELAEDFGGDLLAFIKWMAEQEGGIYGLTNDNGEIVLVEQVTEDAA